MKTRVAVIIPCFNDGATLGETIASVLEQDEESELVVVDDGSTDLETLATLAELEAKGICVIHQENGGLSAARMVGVVTTTSPYILPLDADDLLPAGALSASANALEEHPEFALAWGDIETFGDESAHLQAAFWLDPWEITYYNEIPVNAMLRRDALLDSGGWVLKQGYEDWDLWMSLAERGYRGVHIGRTSLLYRVHGERMWRDALTRHAELVDILRSRHPSLFAQRPANRQQSEAPLLLQWLLPLVGVLPIAERRRFALFQAFAHLAYGRDWRPPLKKRLGSKWPSLRSNR